MQNSRVLALMGKKLNFIFVNLFSKAHLNMNFNQNFHHHIPKLTLSFFLKLNFDYKWCCHNLLNCELRYG
ncbi:hypothetical protein GIB67_020877 [Kingdonia uniflora]|uniref:Uncharacterized protein n=1 Tax=Kingdonia uniflora TaxID=39325 RepID=A0A7J7M7P1_9MAGN|nr:hypothetical protein GIB67_020877 [Kingdonia uniflora]